MTHVQNLSISRENALRALRARLEKLRLSYLEEFRADVRRDAANQDEAIASNLAYFRAEIDRTEKAIETLANPKPLGFWNWLKEIFS